MSLILIAVALLFAVLLCACADEHEGRITAIAGVDTVVMDDIAVDLPRLEVVRNGKSEAAAYDEFWFFADNVYVSGGQLRVKETAPLLFVDALAVTLKADASIVRTIAVERIYVPLEAVVLRGDKGKDYCIVGETLKINYTLVPANASERNVEFTVDNESASISADTLGIPEDFPIEKSLTVTARVNGEVYGSMEVAAKKRAEIATAAQLAAVRLKPGGDYRLTADIADFAGLQTALPIPAFSGTFDGDGHVISGFTLTVPNRSYNTQQSFGLFGELSGSVYDLTLSGEITGAEVHGGSWVNVGLLAGYAAAGVEVRRVAVFGSVSVQRNMSHMGGLVGVLRGVVTDCEATVTINGCGNIGGLVGYGEYMQVLASKAVGCHINASVAYSNRSAGGIIGCSYNAAIQSCLILGGAVAFVESKGIEANALSPAIGYIVGRLDGGKVISVGRDNESRLLSGSLMNGKGMLGAVYNQQQHFGNGPWGFAGKIMNAPYIR
jgi:hypothetical protein